VHGHEGRACFEPNFHEPDRQSAFIGFCGIFFLALFWFFVRFFWGTPAYLFFFWLFPFFYFFLFFFLIFGEIFSYGGQSIVSLRSGK